MTTLAAPAAPTVPPSLVRLLERHDPVRAERVRRWCAGPPPDTVLVLGADEPSVGRLAALLAARVPGLVRCAPTEDAVLPAARVVETRAVVWVFDSVLSEPPAAHWALLAELAGQVERVHLALAGPTDEMSLRAWLAREVPRLAQAPVHSLGDAAGLLDALAHPDDYAGYRNALRVLVTGLAEAAERRADRHRHAAQRQQATDAALRRQADELTVRHRALTGEAARRGKAELAALRVAMSQRLDEARCGLREAARDHLERADRAARARFPTLFATAVTDLVEGVLTEFDAGVADRFAGRLDPPMESAGYFAGPIAARPAIAPPSRAGRSAWEDRLMLLVGGSGGLGLGRVLLTPVGAVAPTAQTWTLPLTVGFGVAAACWLARARQAAAERARLLRWAAEVLADARTAAAAGLTERALGVDQRLAGPVGRAAVEIADQLRDHERLTRRVADRRAKLTGEDRAERDELSAALARLTGLLERDGSSRRTERAW